MQNTFDYSKQTESPRNHRKEITINFLFIYYVISYAIRVLAQCLVKRKTANNEYLNEYLASEMKINNMGIFCCYFSTSFRSANPNFRLRPKLGGQISLWTKRLSEKTNPKSEVAHCLLLEFCLLRTSMSTCSLCTPLVAMSDSRLQNCPVVQSIMSGYKISSAAPPADAT